MAWVGPEDAPGLSELQMTLQQAAWARIDPADPGEVAEGLTDATTRMIRRRGR